MNITPKTLRVVFAAVIATVIALASTDFAQATDYNANRTPKAKLLPTCTFWAVRTPDGVVHKNCVKKPTCLCPAGYN